MFRHHRSLLAATIFALSLSSCDDTAGPSSSEGWIDPRIAPRVVATYPLDGTTGPFELFVPGTYLIPHFIVQMNKAINRFEFESNWFAVQGFDRPVRTYLLQSFERDPFPRRATAADPLVGLLALAVYDSAGFGASMRYRIGRTYAVTVQTTLEDATGRHPELPYRFSFQPEPYFRVTSVAPEDGDERVHPSSYPILKFNAVIDTTIFASLQLSPSSPGHWALTPYDSTSLSFVPTEPFPFGTQYTLTVHQEAADVDGNRLREAFVSRFRILPFKIVSNEPQNGFVGVYPGTGVSVVASGPLDPTTVAAAFSIEPAVAGTLTTESSRISLQPTMPLALDTRYTVRISTALRAADGTPLSAPHTFWFRTDRLRIFYTTPYDGGLEVPRNSLISVQCNTVVDLGSAAAAFSITPAVAGAIEMTYDYGFSFRPNTLLEANRFYTVTISTALRSSSGTFLAAPHQFTFRTGAL